MASEKASSKRLVLALNSIIGCKAYKKHGSVWGEAGAPDIFCICLAKCFVFEMKKRGGVVSAIQEVRLLQWSNAGANCYVAISVDEALNFLMERLTTAERYIIEKQDLKPVHPAILKALKKFL